MSAALEPGGVMKRSSLSVSVGHSLSDWPLRGSAGEGEGEGRDRGRLCEAQAAAMREWGCVAHPLPLLAWAGLGMDLAHLPAVAGGVKGADLAQLLLLNDCSTWQ